MKIKLLFICSLILSASAMAQNDDDWKFSGQIQLRTELDGRDFINETYPLTYTSLRTKVGVAKSISDQASFFVQLRDSRVFGEEPGTLAQIRGVDLHQGYVLLTKPLGLPLKLQAGRFEISYGTERFFGAVGWHYVGRSFDGARLSFNVYDNITFDLFAATISEPVSYIANATPNTYGYPAVPSTSSSLYGFWKTVELNKDHRIDGFGYYETSRANTVSGDNILDQFTIGMDHFGKYGALSSTIEAAYQAGTTGPEDIAAYLISLQLNYTAGITQTGIGADILSGTEPGAEKYNTFRPTYGTNHKFYGFMDYFINIPDNTSNAGLNDFYVSVAFRPENSKLSWSLMVHHFMSNIDRELANVESVYGQEADLTLKYDFIKGTAITWGGSLFFPGELMKYAFRVPGKDREDIAFWSYLMITANF